MKMGILTRSGALLSLLFLPGGCALGRQTSALAPAQTSSSREDAPVVAVRIVTRDGRIVPTPAGGLPVVVGKPLDPEAVRESIRTLYRSGDFQDIQAVRASEAGGVRLDFVVRESLFFNRIQIEGIPAPPSEASASAALQISLGQVFHQYTLEEALDRLRETLREEGLYEAQLTAETAPNPATHQLDVVVHVEPGPRARMGEIRLLNHTGYSDRELLERTRFAPGKEITVRRLQSGAERIRKFFTKKGHLSSRAVVRRGSYDAFKKIVPLEMEITEGPRVRVEVTGAKFSGGTLKKLIPIYQEGAVDADLLEEGRRNLQERLERDGYFDAEVKYTTEMRDAAQNRSGWKGKEVVVTYTIERGERHKLVGVEISGNHYFDAELLRGRLRILTAAFASRGRFSRRLLDSDADSMRGLYQANGFAEARVQAVTLDNYNGDEGALFIRFVIQEGTQTRVASLTITGNHSISQDELLGVVGSNPGQPYSEFNVASDRDNILAMYFNEGFPEAHFQAKVEEAFPSALPGEYAAGGGFPDAPKLVHLHYQIEEGPQVRVRNILYSGRRHTRLGVIRREVRFRQGQPLRLGEVVESQRDLYNLGIFNRVTIEPQNPTGADPEKNVVVQVEETKRYTLAYGGGIEVQRLPSTTDPTGSQLRASPRGILEVSKVNLTGRADSLSLKLRGSTLQGRALLGYSAPRTFGKKQFSFQAVAFAEKTRDISTFNETRYEGSVQLTQSVSPVTTLLYRYAFRKVLVGNLRITPEAVPLFNQPTLVSEFGMTWFRDRRNNPADPTTGTFNSLDVSLADTGIASSASFLRFFGQNSTYHPIGKRFSFARSVRLGILQPYRDTASLEFPAPTVPPLPTVIPLPERFFAGGGTSLRGFALNQAGPRDALTGFPVGGQAELILNQEFRFPMRVPYFGTQLGGALFYDAGNVFSRVSRLTLRWSPPVCQSNCTNELNYFSHTIGFGVRYGTPVGPIRVDIGYQLNRATFVIPCTNAVPGCRQAARLPRLQFFFNLGAPF